MVIPQFLKVIPILNSNNQVVYDQDILMIFSGARGRPVQTARDNIGVINYAILVVHHYAVQADGAWDALGCQVPYIGSLVP